MADKGIPVAEATTGTLDMIDTKTMTNGASETVQRQRITIGDSEATLGTAQTDFGDHTATAVTDPTNVTTAATAMAIWKGILKVVADVWSSGIHALGVFVTDGTHTMPTGDASARAIHVAIDADNTPAMANPLPVQLSDATNDAVIRAGSAEAVLTDAAAVMTLRPSENHVGEVGGKSSIVKVPLTVTAGAYTAGMSVGGLVDLGAILRKVGGTGVLQSLLVSDHANQKAPLAILLFDAAPASTFTDHVAAPTLSQTDLGRLIRAMNVAATDYTTTGGSAIADLSSGGRVVAGNASQHLWMAVVTSGTPTYAATTDLSINLGFLLD